MSLELLQCPARRAATGVGAGGVVCGRGGVEAGGAVAAYHPRRGGGAAVRV